MLDYREFAQQMMENVKLFNKDMSHSMRGSMRGEGVILYHLLHAQDTMLPSTISVVMDTSTARTAAALNSLEDKGLITRTINREDRRQILVSLTPKGIEEAQEREKIYMEDAARLFSILGEEDAGEFVRILSKLRKFHNEQHHNHH